jgi:chorismate mutase
MSGLYVYRFCIDRIDDLIYTLLRARFMITTRTILYKRDNGIIDVPREKNIIQRLGHGSLEKPFVEKLWTLIFSHSKHLQHIFLNQIKP